LGTEGVGIQAGEPAGYGEGSVGWVVDEPRCFPDGSAMKTRLTAVAGREDRAWRLVHLHVSVGGPDDAAAELLRRWSSASRPHSPAAWDLEG
jgi:hypothetical protein